MRYLTVAVFLPAWSSSVIIKNKIGSITSFINHYKFILTSLQLQITFSDLFYANSHSQLDVKKFTSNACRALNCHPAIFQYLIIHTRKRDDLIKTTSLMNQYHFTSASFHSQSISNSLNILIIMINRVLKSAQVKIVEL